MTDNNLVRLPRSATTRRSPTYLKLLHRVGDASSAYRFHGVLFRPGERIPEARLWPTAEYPPRPVLLESVQLDFEGRGHNRNPRTYILWLYEPETSGWQEIARAKSVDASWVHDLAPIARRLLQDAPQPSQQDVFQRLKEVLHEELGRMDADARLSTLTMLHDELACTYTIALEHKSIDSRVSLLGM